MTKNKLHINMSKSVHMHFKPSLNFSDRLTCARVRGCGNEHLIKIGDQKLKKVDQVKFLGVVMDKDLKWDLGTSCSTPYSKIKISFNYDKAHY